MKEKNKSDQLIKLAIKRMIPSGPLGKKQLSNCKIYRDSNHKHEAQNPQVINIGSLNKKNIIQIMEDQEKLDNNLDNKDRAYATG